MATKSETQVVAEIGARLQVRLPRRPKDYFFKSGRGLSHETRRGDLGAQERAGVDAEVPPEGARLLHRAPDADLGRRHERDRLRRHLLLHPARPRSRRHRGTTCPPTSRTRSTSSGIPEAERKFLAGVGAQYESRGRLPQAPGGPREAGRDLPRHGLRPARAPGARQAVLRHGHPAERQQVRGAEQRGLVGRLVHLRAEGRARRDAAAGLLPHQRGEHGPVRAHADHRRRGRLRALRRGLHRADLLDRLAALARSSRSSSRRAAAAATRRSRTGRRTSTTSSPSARSPTRTRRWSGSTATSARS